MPTISPGRTVNETSCRTGWFRSYPNVTLSKRISPRTSFQGSGFAGSVTMAGVSSSSSTRLLPDRKLVSQVVKCDSAPKGA